MWERGGVGGRTNINGSKKEKQWHQRRRNGPHRGGAVVPSLCFCFNWGKPSWGVGWPPRSGAIKAYRAFWGLARRRGWGRAGSEEPEGPWGSQSHLRGARLRPTDHGEAEAQAGPGCLGGCPRPGGGVVLPPARLQIAIAAARQRAGRCWEGGSPSAWLIRRESVGLGGAVEWEGDKSGGRGWLPERGARLKSFTAPEHKTS